MTTKTTTARMTREEFEIAQRQANRQATADARIAEATETQARTNRAGMGADAPSAGGAALLKVARNAGIETLETRGSDSLDFHDLAVWQVREMLEAAYQAGRAAAR